MWSSTILTHRAVNRAALVYVALCPFGRLTAQAPPPAPLAAWNRAAAAAYLDAREAWWLDWPNAARDHETTCLSCHTALPYALARPSLRAALGETAPTPSESELLHDVALRVTEWNDVDPYYPDQTVGLPKTSESRGTEAVLNALVLARRDARKGRLSPEARRAFANLWKLQFRRGDLAGAWAWLRFDLAPWESEGAEYFGAALAAVAVGSAPEGYAPSAEVQEPLGALRDYLRRDWERRSRFDQVMTLWAAARLPDLLIPDERRSAIEGLLRVQNPDGGWSSSALGAWQRRDESPQQTASDGYATGAGRVRPPGGR